MPVAGRRHESIMYGRRHQPRTLSPAVQSAIRRSVLRLGIALLFGVQVVTYRRVGRRLFASRRGGEKLSKLLSVCRSATERRLPIY
jgi:hypothetical protein